MERNSQISVVSLLNVFRNFFYYLTHKVALSHPVRTSENLNHLSILRVSSVETQVIYCELKWRHVSTHRVIIRPVIDYV